LDYAVGRTVDRQIEEIFRDNSVQEQSKRRRSSKESRCKTGCRLGLGGSRPC
jgi:hypothetical protein